MTQAMSDSEHRKSQESALLTPHALWTVDLKLTHLDWNPEATLIHFQGQYLTICDLDYVILQGEIQNVPKNKVPVEVGEFCLVEDTISARWFRGRVQKRNNDLFDVFLMDHGNVLSVNIAHISSCSNELFNLPPKIVCGFLANVLLLQNCSHSEVEGYFSSLIGRNVTGVIQALLPHKVLLLEALDINSDLVRHGFGRHVDTDTFLLLVGMLTEVPLKQNTEPVPDLLIEKPRVQGFSFKSSSLQGFEDMLSFCGPRLSCGTRAYVRVTAAVNPGLFYCQMAKGDIDLRQMSKTLAAVCEYRTKNPNQKTADNLGVLCAVKGKDEKWYRGFVQFLPVSSQVRVFFIDYGFFEFVRVENVHRLPAELYSAPVMAFPCSLPSLTDQDVKAKQLSFLKAGLLGAVLDVEIKGFEEKQHLYTIAVLGVAHTHAEKPKLIQNLPIPAVLDVKDMSPQSGYANYETIMSEPLNKTLEVEEVKVDSDFVGFVVYAENPNHFWIRTQNRNEEFEEIMSEITKHFSQMKLDEDVLQDLEVGAMCCAVYEEDMHFYRGVVIDVLDHGAEILFTDFGNIEKVPHTLIKNLPERFANKSPFAMCCTLVNVFPLGDVWATDTCDFFRKAVSDLSLLVHLVQVKKHKCVVDLFQMESQKNITELLVSSGQAEYIPLEPALQKSKQVTEETKRLQLSATTHMSGRSQEREDFGKEEDECKKETEKVEAPASLKALNIKPGIEFPVSCTNIRSPSDFWCQPQDQAPALEKLMDDIQHYYSAHTVCLQPGESCCVVKSPQDGKWYRGFITEKQKGYATVTLVDYGTIIQVREHHLQTILPEYSHLEEQAFRCSLYNQIEHDWTAEACDLLKDFVLKSTGNLKCQVVSQLNVKNKGLCNVVHLYNTQTQQSITNTLLQQKLEKTKPMSQESEVFPESFVYSSFDLSPGSEEQVYVTYVSNQCELFCHLDRNTEIIEELENKISEESEKLVQADAGAVVEKLCLAKYLDGKWYRGWMLPVQIPLHFRVFFVDYGNTNILEKTKVMFIPRNCEDLLFTPMQAVKFNLDLVPEEEHYADVKKWLNNAVIDKLMRVVVQAKREDGSFDVELFDGEISINEKIKELILSLSQKPKTVRLASRKIVIKNSNTRCTKTHFKGKSPPKWQLPNSTSNVHKGSQLKKKKNCARGRLQNKNTKSSQQNETNRRRFPSVKPQTKSERKQNVYLSEESQQTPQSEETKMSQLLRLPEKSISPGFRAKCFVSHIDSVSRFSLQLSDDEPNILKMGELLNSVNFKDSLETASSFQVDDVVLAEFEEDGALYRSVVKKKEESSCFKVEFVDYGNSAVVGRENMHPLPEEFQSQPRFSIPCSLLDTRTYEDDASFIDAVIERPLMVNFVGQCGLQWQVKLEVLDGEIEHPATLESSLPQNEESLLSPPESNEKVISCEQTRKEQGYINEQVNETISTIEGESMMSETAPDMLPSKQKVKTARCLRGLRSKKTSHRKTKTSSVEVMKDHPYAFLPPTVQLGETENGTILSVQKEGCFYVRLTKYTDLLAALEKRIDDNLNKCTTVAKADIKQGLKCLVQTQDKKWQRAVVQHKSEGTLKVFLVDHGLTKDIPSGSILLQCTNLTKLQNLAVLCRMNSFGFPETETGNQCWHKTLEPMRGTEIKLIFESYSESGNIWMVEILLNGQFLVPQIKASHQQNDEETISPAETQSEALQGEQTSDTSAPQQLTFAPVETDKAYSGYVATVATPFKFCVVLEDMFSIKNKLALLLENLPPEIPSLPEAHLVPGTCCLLKSESRNKQCRAEIVNVDSTVVLNLVDEGHHESIPYHDFSKLKKLPVELTGLPKVIYPCVLRGVNPDGGDGQWTDEATAFFQECLYQKIFQIFFRELVSNTEWRVDILTEDIVANMLVDAGHATYTDLKLKPRFQATSSCKPEGCGIEEEEEEEEEEEDSPEEAEAADEPVGEMSVSMKSSSHQCLLM